MSVAAPPGRVQSTLAANKLGTLTLIFFAISAAAPLTILVGLVPVAWQVTGVPGLPLAFVIVGLVLAVFSVGYIAMAQRIRNAGAFYSYVAQGLGKPFGVAAAFLAVPAYGLMAIALFGAIGPTAVIFLPDSVAAWMPWWGTALLVCAFVAVMGVLRVDVNGKVLALALISEVVLVVICDVINLANPTGGTVSVDTLEPASLAAGQLGVAFAIVVTSFVGFEAPPIFSEESKDARKTVGRAIYRGLAVMTLGYAFSTWAMAAGIGPQNLQQVAEQHPSDLLFVVVAEQFGGQVITDVGRVLYLTSLVAAALSYHNNVTRYLFALGRERVMFGFLGRTSPRSFAPRNASLVLSGITAATILGYAVSGADPMVQLFYWLGTGGGFGILLLIVATSVSVPCYFFVRHRRTAPDDRVSVLRAYVAPIVAAGALGYIVWLIFDNFAGLLGVAEDSPMRFAFPITYTALAFAGAAWALILYLDRPDIYRAIGLGATPTAADDLVAPTPPAYLPAHGSTPGNSR